MVKDRWQTLDIHYQGCPAEVSYSLDARRDGDKHCHRSLFLELVAFNRLWYFVSRYFMGASLVGK